MPNPDSQFRDLADLSPDAFIIQVEGKVVYCNQSARHMFHDGESVRLIGIDAIQLVDPDCRDFILTRRNKVLSTGEPAPYTEARLLRLDGTSFPSEMVVGHVTWDGRAGTMNIIHDITKRKEAEKALQKSETLFRSFIDNLPAQVFVKDTTGRFTLVNRAWEKNQGVSGKEATGKTVYDIFPEDKADIFAAQDQAVLETGQVYDRELELRRGNRRLFLHTIKFPISGAEGEVTAIGGIATDITEHKRAEKALRESERRNRDLFDHAVVGIYRTTPDGRHLEVNPALARMRGCDSPAKFMAHFLDARHPIYVDPAAREEMNGLMCEKGYVVDFESESYRRDGTRFWMSETGRAVRDETGQLIAYEGFIVDITARRRAEEALRESEGRFKDIASATADWFWEMGPDLRFTYVSERFFEVTGFRPEERIGTPRTRYVDPTDREVDAEKWAAHLADLDTHKSFKNFEFSITSSTGRACNVRISGTPNFDSDGEFLGYRGTGTDITEHKRAERLFMEQKQLLQAVVDAVPVIISVKDRELRFLMVNQMQAEELGCTPEEAIGKHRVAFQRRDISSEEGQRYTDVQTDREQEVLRTGEAQLFYEESFTYENGEVEHRLVNKIPLHDADGQIYAILTVAMDITERKQAEQEIQKLNEDLERRVEERTAELRAAQDTLLQNERLSTLGQLTATVSHELRNPLGVIRTSTFILRGKLTGEEPLAERTLDRIERNVVRCDRIIDELLDFTRISQLEPEPTLINAWLEETLNEQTLPSGVALRLTFHRPNLAVSIDRDRFRRAIINVFDNACQAMIGDGIEDADSEEHTLTVRTQKCDGRVDVIFLDTGPGIPPDVYKMIFEPLYSTKGFGVGLGLPVVKHIMEQHGGGIEIESEEGRGTRVCLWLPTSPSTH